ncbi:hypothetical protein niasHS_013188 [Heterodera schachtii]|uniref:Uncharacterized protein n=1 Tax=Heterodera schachtii TaxID=97005 RepID=A0ABD2IAQ2_HETSC
MLAISETIQRLASPTRRNANENGPIGKGPRHRSFFDAFCDYTSISGFRFMHSRYPLWFRSVSGLVLFGSIGMFLFHSSVFIRRFNDKRNSIQLFTTKAHSIDTPFIVICPLRQVKSIFYYDEDGPPDFIHIVSRFYDTSNVLPGKFPSVDGVSVRNSTERALRVAQNFLNLATRHFADVDQGATEVLNGAKQFVDDPTLRKLFPKCSLLLSFEKVLTMAQNWHSVYANFDNFREWVCQSEDPCYAIVNETDKTMRNSVTVLKFARCRANATVAQLEKVLRKIDTFHEYVQTAQPPVDDVILFCRWLDGGKCTKEYVRSELGIDCVKLGGIDHIKTSYATLRNNIDVVIDLSAFDNKLATWKESELQMILCPTNETTVCTSVDGFI